MKAELTYEILVTAMERAAATPVYRGSHRGAKANEVGAIGEIVVIRYLKEMGVPFFEDFVTSHDLRLHDDKTVEVKTKDRTVVPQLGYDCSIPLYNSEHQSTQYHIFVSLRRDSLIPTERIDRYKEAFIVGVANKKIVTKCGRIMTAGQTDLTNGTQFWTDCINIEIGELKPISEAATIWKNRG